MLVPIGHGSEEIESVTIIDTLVRGGAKVTVASVANTPNVVMSRGVKMTADVLITECTEKKSGLLGFNFCTFEVIGSPSVPPSRTLSPSSNTDDEMSVAEMKSCESMHSS